MSHIENDRFVESMNQMFDEALALGNIEKCRLVIEMLLEDDFRDEANALLDELLNQPLSTFTHPSDQFVW